MLVFDFYRFGSFLLTADESPSVSTSKIILVFGNSSGNVLLFVKSTASLAADVLINLLCLFVFKFWTYMYAFVLPLIGFG